MGLARAMWEGAAVFGQFCQTNENAYRYATGRCRHAAGFGFPPRLPHCFQTTNKLSQTSLVALPTYPRGSRSHQTTTMCSFGAKYLTGVLQTGPQGLLQAPQQTRSQCQLRFWHCGTPPRAGIGDCDGIPTKGCKKTCFAARTPALGQFQKQQRTVSTKNRVRTVRAVFSLRSSKIEMPQTDFCFLHCNHPH